jgi:LysM domain
VHLCCEFENAFFMKKLAILLLIGLSFAKTSWSQSYDLNVQSEAGKLYINHAVQPKENWYSIGRLYNISPKEIAPFNGTTLDKPLAIGEHLKIPLIATNFSQDGQKAADETFVAVYHTVQEKEPLTRISANYNNVALANLEKWNHIGKDQPKTGLHLVVGYLKVKPLLSALAAKGGKDQVAIAVVPPKKEDNSENENPVVKEEKKAAPVTKSSPLVVKQENKQSTPPSTENNTPPANAHAISHSNGGYCINEYNDGSKRTGGVAGIFKSTSGWQDGKYYALLSNVAVGTIVKVSVPTTNKTIYAKVLGPLPDMKESAGLAIRISNAAATELGQAEGNFSVEVRY